MYKISSVILSSVLAVSLAGCYDQGRGGITAAQGGTLLGGVGGGLVGTQIGHGQGRTIAIITGTLLGAFLGNRLGSAMDQQSQAAADQSAQMAFQTGQPHNWQTSSASGSVVPHHKYYQHNRQCRKFTTMVNIGKGKTQTVNGTACRNSRGQWVVVG